MSTLLNKTRMLNKILQKTGTEPVVFDDICNVLSDVLKCNVYIISRKGKILGYNIFSGFECEVLKNDIVKVMKFPDSYNNKLLNVYETRLILNNKGKCVFKDELKCDLKNKISTISSYNWQSRKTWNFVTCKI